MGRISPEALLLTEITIPAKSINGSVTPTTGGSVPVVALVRLVFLFRLPEDGVARLQADQGAAGAGVGHGGSGAGE